MIRIFLQPILAALLLTVTGCAAVTGVESIKQDNYVLAPSSLLILNYADRAGENDKFLAEATQRLTACGVSTDSYTVIIMGHDINISRNIVKSYIQQKIEHIQAKTILEVVPARETFTNYGTVKLGTDYIVSLKDLSDNKLWTARMAQHQPTLFSYAFMPNPDIALADAVIEKMALDGVLTHCPAKPAS